MIRTVAVSNYRSLRFVELPFAPVTTISGGNGSGKSNLYRALRLLSEPALGAATASIAHEGGLPSVLWAGLERFSRGTRDGSEPVQRWAVTRSLVLAARFCWQHVFLCD